MSQDAANLFNITASELGDFLSSRDDDTLERAGSAIAVNKTTDTVLLVSVSLFIVSFLLFNATVFVWISAKKLRRKHGYERINETENIVEECDKDSLQAISAPYLPQVFQKPVLFENNEAQEPPPADEELRMLNVEDIDLVANFDTKKDVLDIRVTRINLQNASVSLREKTNLYYILSFDDGPQSLHPPFVESSLRPLAEENYFDEPAEFKLTIDDVSNVKLKVLVYVSNTFSQHQMVNEYAYQMSVNASENEKILLPVTLVQVSRSDDNQISDRSLASGEILFSLCYMPTSGRLTFVALKSRNISSKQANGPSVIFLRISLLTSGRTTSTVQSCNKRSFSADLVYNEAFVFNVPLEKINDSHIAVSICSKVHTNAPTEKVIGRIVAGPVASSNLGRKHWQSMLSSPRKPIAQWHTVVD